MLNIVSIPKIPKIENRQLTTNFLKSKQWIIDMITAQRKIFLLPEYDEIKNSLRVKLCSLSYMANYNDYLIRSINNELNNILNRFNNIKSTEFLEINENSVENEYNLIEKIDIERLEKRLSSNAVDYLRECYCYEPKRKRKSGNYSKFTRCRTIREQIKKIGGYTNKSLKIIEKEIKDTFKKKGENINSGGVLKELIDREIH